MSSPSPSSASPAPVAAVQIVPPNPVLPTGVRLYECMWVVDSNTGREDYNKVLEALKEIVSKGGGSWINAEKWEERRLAYPIKKKKRGLYIICHFSAPTDTIIKIDRNAKLSEVVLRHMITVDEDGLTLIPQVRTIEDDDFGGGFGGGGSGGGSGGERRFFGGGGEGGREGGGRSFSRGGSGGGSRSY